MGIKILAGLPTYDGTRYNSSALGSLKLAGVSTFECASSLLAAAFNRCWAKALNSRADGVTHFLLLHADVIPVEDTWLQELLEEFEANKCQVLSAVIPVKAASGITSIGWETENIWRPRRLTLRELHDRSVTWTHPKLLVNTGMLLVDFRQPWVEKIAFTINDRISFEGGRWAVDVEPEDWNFSRQCRALGVPVHVTRRVALSHVGAAAYRNDFAWGQAHDPNTPEPVDWDGDRVGINVSTGDVDDAIFGGVNHPAPPPER
jgi:hypothetical protein